MISFGKLKTDLRLRLFPTGEAPNLVVSHNAAFVDAIIDLQTWVDCLKRDNTDLVAQCATLFHCGVTVFDAPRGNIIKLSVMDKVKATAAETAAAAATVETDFPLTPIFDPPPDAKIVFTATRSGPVKITLSQSTDMAGLISPPGPQFVLVTLSYTDINNIFRTSQPAGKLLWGQADSVTEATINCAAGSTVTATITVSNIPFNDGGYTISIIAEDAGSVATDDDWCSEIPYHQVNFCGIRNLMSKTAKTGCGFDFTQFLALPTCGKSRFPEPDDANTKGLPTLPLGYHYGQKSTDTKSRASHGVWAIERGKIYIAPWIQSTETVIIKWDGIKRTWNDGDMLDDDPLLLRAIENFVAWEHYSKWERDAESAASALQRYNEARSMLMYQCDEENRIRDCEPSRARGTSFSSENSTGTLYYNDQARSFTAKCGQGMVGSDVTVTISSGTVASNISVSDANQKAFDQAQAEAQSQLDCTDVPPSFTNDAQSFTAVCTAGGGAPNPTGSSVTRTVSAGTVTSSVSKAAANAAALAQAQAEAEAALQCTWNNAQQTATAVCASDNTKTQTVTVAAGVYTSTVSQDDANAKAMTAAQNQANTQLASAGCVGVGTTYSNTIQTGAGTVQCSQVYTGPGGHPAIRVIPFTVNVHVAPGTFTSTVSQADANALALNYANGLGRILAQQNCSVGTPQIQTVNYP